MEERRAHHGTLNFQHPHPHGNISTQTRCNDIGRKHANPNPNHYTCNAKRAKSTEFFHKKKKKCCLKTCSFSCCGRTPRSTWHPQLSTFTLKQGHTHPAVMQRHRSPTCRPRPKLLHMKCGKPKVHRVLPQKGKQVMFEKLLCCVFVEELRAQHGTLNFQHTHSHEICPHSWDAMASAANSQTRIQTITNGMRKAQDPHSSSTKGNRSDVWKPLFFRLWKNSALNMAPSIFEHSQPHRHIATQPRCNAISHARTNPKRKSVHM